MTRTTRRLLLGGWAILMAALLAAFLADRELTRGATRPGQVAALGAWIRDHPADWLAANALSEVALDSALPRRIEVWRAAYEHASRLAPRKPHPRTSFVRGGLFHWYELPKAERGAVLAAAAPLLKDPYKFAAMQRPLWELTNDFDYLRRNAPDDERALIWLRDTAAASGRFEDYRELRDAIDRKHLQTLQANRAALAPPQLIALLPPKLTSSDEQLVQETLAELQRRPLDATNAAAAQDRADELVGFAIRHQLRPLDGLEAWIDVPAIKAPTRARLALALGRADEAANIELTGTGRPEDWVAYYLERSAFETARGDTAMAELYARRAAIGVPDGAPQWRGTCGPNEVCRTAVARFRAARAGDPIVINVQKLLSDDVPPYVEVYVDDARVAEGPVANAQRFSVAARTAGLNRVEVRLVNPRARNRIQRRVRLS